MLYQQHCFLYYDVGLEEKCNTHVAHIPVIDYFHCSVLLYPQLAQDDIMHAAVRITPCVHFVVPKKKKGRNKKWEM